MTLAVADVEKAEVARCQERSWRQTLRQLQSLRLLRSLPLFVKGDVDAFVSLFSNSLSTALLAANLLLEPLGAEVVFDRVLPAMAISTSVGCLYYVVQAQLKAVAHNRSDLCAQPFGINTPGAFAFYLAIILPVYQASLKTHGHAHAQQLAWEVGVFANLIQGITEILLSVFGPFIAKCVPTVALFGSLSSVGFTFLFTNTFQDQMAYPLVGVLPFFVLAISLYAKLQIPNVPATLVSVCIGTAFAWATGLTTSQAVMEATSSLGWHPCQVSLHIPEMSNVLPYISTIIPTALTVSVGTIQCRESAAVAGDEYNLRASMFGDGLLTVFAALCGSPFGLTIYIGHPTFKAMGAHIGYSLLTAFCILIVCFFGLGAMILAIFPIQALNPILLFIGLEICIESLTITPSRHLFAFITSLVPCIANWAVSQAQAFAQAICDYTAQHATTSCSIDPSSPGSWTLSPRLAGLFALGQGYLLSSIFIASMLLHIIDRRFLQAAAWSLLAATSSSIGLIHSSSLHLPWKGPDEPDGYFVRSVWSAHWQYACLYAACSLIFASIWLLQRGGLFDR